MGLISGSASIARFNVVSCPDLPDFDRLPFKAIDPASEIRESIGFVPFEPEEPYQVGHSRFAFRVRIDTRRPDATAVKERVKALVKTELEETGAPYVGPQKRKILREMAEEELLSAASPSTRIVEGAIDDDVLYVGTTAKNQLGRVVLLLRQLGVVAELKTPWGDAGEAEVMSDIVETSETGESVLGCWFLKDLVDDSDLMVEPESGYVQLQTHDAKVTLHGGVLPDLHRYVQRGSEILAAKLTTPDITFRFTALPFRVSSLRIETGRHDHWIEQLDERLEKISGVYEMLDRKYDAFRKRQPGRPAAAEAPKAAPGGAGETGGVVN